MAFCFHFARAKKLSFFEDDFFSLPSTGFRNNTDRYRSLLYTIVAYQMRLFCPSNDREIMAERLRLPTKFHEKLLLPFALQREENK